MKTLHLGVNEKDLESLAKHAPKLTTLDISSQDPPPSHYIFQVVSHFTHLTRLSFQFGPECSVRDQDLLVCARKNPGLEQLLIEEDWHPSGVGICDSLIEELAQKLPRVKRLSLVFDPPEMLTQLSVASITKHCKNIFILKVSCKFDWREAVDGAQKITSTTLCSLDLFLPESDGIYNINQENPEIINGFATRFLLSLPKVNYFKFSSHYYGRLNKALNREIDGQMWVELS